MKANTPPRIASRAAVRAAPIARIPPWLGGCPPLAVLPTTFRSDSTDEPHDRVQDASRDPEENLRQSQALAALPQDRILEMAIPALARRRRFHQPARIHPLVFSATGWGKSVPVETGSSTAVLTGSRRSAT